MGRALPVGGFPQRFFLVLALPALARLRTLTVGRACRGLVLPLRRLAHVQDFALPVARLPRAARLVPEIMN